MAEDRASYGIVVLQLDGEDVELIPSLRALQKIQNRFGGLSPAIQDLTKLNIDSLAYIVAAGLGVNGTKETSKIKDQIFTAGLSNVIGKIGDYLGLLMNPTGRESTDEGENDDLEK